MTKQELAKILKLIIFERFDGNASEYARSAGISTSTLYSYRNEDAFPGKAKLGKLIKAAGMTDEEFFGKKPLKKAEDYDKEVALRHKTVYPTSAEYWTKDNDRRGEDRRRKKIRRVDDIKRKILDDLTATFDETTKAGKDHINRIIDFLEFEIMKYRKPDTTRKLKN